MVDSPIKINSEICERSNACVQVCPLKIYVDAGDKVEVDRPGRCIRCGHCVAVCPSQAIAHSLLKTDEFENAGELRTMSFGDVESLFKTRRTCRTFLSEQVSRNEIEKLLDAARYAPTAANAQNVRYMVVTNPNTIKQLRDGVGKYYLKLASQLSNPVSRALISISQGKRTVEAYRYHMSTISELFRNIGDGEDRLYYGAKTLVIVMASGVAHIALAAGNLAAMQIMLSARSLGLGACYNGYTLTALTRDRKLKQSVGIPKGVHPAAVVALGKPGIEFRLVPARRKPKIIWEE